MTLCVCVCGWVSERVSWVCVCWCLRVSVSVVQVYPLRMTAALSRCSAKGEISRNTSLQRVTWIRGTTGRGTICISGAPKNPSLTLHTISNSSEEKPGGKNLLFFSSPAASLQSRPQHFSCRRTHTHTDVVQTSLDF